MRAAAVENLDAAEALVEALEQEAIMGLQQTGRVGRDAASAPTGLQRRRAERVTAWIFCRAWSAREVTIGEGCVCGEYRLERAGCAVSRKLCTTRRLTTHSNGRPRNDTLRRRGIGCTHPGAQQWESSHSDCAGVPLAWSGSAEVRLRLVWAKEC